MKLFSVLLVAVSLFSYSCERHDFEGPDGTRQLHEHHGAAHHGDAEDGDESHAAEPAH